MMMRKTNNSFFKIASESSHNFFLCHYRLVLIVGTIFYYYLAEDGIGPPRWPVENSTRTWKQHNDLLLRHAKIVKLDLCCIHQRLPTTTIFVVNDFLVDCCSHASFTSSSMHVVVYSGGHCGVFVLSSCGTARIQSPPGTECLPKMGYVDSYFHCRPHRQHTSIET
jgi:hypothetical protein